MIARVGPSDANVLITGENGTGKGVVAQALHAASSRATRPMVTVNAGGLSEGVFESELFGHVKGAFTDAKTDRVGRFELADGGTLFLDEIANVAPAAAGEAAARARDGRVRAGRLVAHAQGERARHLRDQRRPVRGGRRRALPPGPALPPEHGRNPPPAAARAPRGHPAARHALPPPARAALSQAAHGLRRGGDAGAGRAPLAGQRARAGPRRRARRPHGAGPRGPRRRPQPEARRATAPPASRT